MKLARFTRTDGTEVLINPDAVASVSVFNNATLIRLRAVDGGGNGDGLAYAVKGDLNEVARTLLYLQD